MSSQLPAVLACLRTCRSRPRRHETGSLHCISRTTKQQLLSSTMSPGLQRAHRCAPLQAMSRGLQTVPEGGSQWNLARRCVMTRSAPAAAASQAPPISRHEKTDPNSAGQDALQSNDLDLIALIQCITIISHLTCS